MAWWAGGRWGTPVMAVLSDIQADVAAIRLVAHASIQKVNKLREEVRIMAGQTAAALAELSGAIDEVAGELDGIAAQLAEALSNDDAIDEATAGQIRAAASRLRGLRPAPEQPADEEPSVEPAPEEG